MTNAKGMPKSECRMKRHSFVSLVGISKMRVSFVIRHSDFGQSLIPSAVTKLMGKDRSMLRPEQNGLLIRAFDLDAVGFD